MRLRMMAMVAASVLVLACSVRSQTTLTQTIPVGFDTVVGGATSPFTFGTFPNLDQVWQFHYANSNFNQTGPILITELYIRPDRGAVSLAAFNFPNLTVTIGEAATGYTVGQHASNFAANFAGSQAVVRSGPWTSGPIPASATVTGTWVALGLSQGYTFDPSSGLDLVIQVERCGAASPWTGNVDCVSGTGIGGNRYGAVGNCAATSSTTQGNEFCPVFRIDYQPVGGFAYETNDAAASLTVDGVVGNVFNKAQSVRCVGNNVAVRFASTGVGLGWDVGISGAPLVDAFSGGFPTATGQIVNLNFAGPGGILFLNGGVFPDLAGTFFPAPNFEVPVALPAAPGFLSGQSLHVDPASAEGISLSQGCEVEILTGPLMVPGPVGDDSSVTIPLAGPALCGPLDFSFYGTRYSEIHVISNGRVTFARPDTTYAPTSALSASASDPSVGAWTDFNPAVGGTITVSNVAGVIRTDFNMVPYFSGLGAANTFAIELDPAGSVVRLQGLLGISAAATDMMFLGISPGSQGSASDPGPAAFMTNTGATTNATDMIYEFGGAGTLATGIDQIIFLPNNFGNYDWISL